MDAVPITVRQAFDAFARQVRNGAARLHDALPRLRMLPQGGTAVGTGLNAPPGFDAAFREEASALAGMAFAPKPSKFEGMAAHDVLVEVSGVLNVIAVSLVTASNLDARK